MRNGSMTAKVHIAIACIADVERRSFISSPRVAFFMAPSLHDSLKLFRRGGYKIRFLTVIVASSLKGREHEKVSDVG